MERESRTEMTANEPAQMMRDRAKEIRAKRVKECEQAISEKLRKLEGMHEGLAWWESAIPFDVLKEDAASRKRVEEKAEIDEDRERRKNIEEEIRVHEIRQHASYRVVAWIFGSMFIAYVVSAFLPAELGTQKVILGFWLSIFIGFVASIAA